MTNVSSDPGDQSSPHASLGWGARLILIYFGVLIVFCLLGLSSGGGIVLNPDGLGRHEESLTMLGVVHAGFLVWLFLRLRAVQAEPIPMKAGHVIINLGLMVFLVWAMGQALRGPAWAWTLDYWGEESQRELTLVGISPDGLCLRTGIGRHAACAVHERQGKYHLHFKEWDETLRTNKTYGLPVYEKRVMRVNYRVPIPVVLRTRENWAVLLRRDWALK
ncbi:hypothetical protein [Marimonas lutisalis]|uniref:hypothetical protein n=1 Tax=Marimonas lutisalis TaxID=2545756 RepID=UPI0010FA3A13|nr:hypothetical protein [Marimonas lutisalis]